MTTSLPRARWQPHDDYDDDARWRDDADGGDRWRNYASCRDADSELFFPIGRSTEEEPPYPPAEAKAICDRCPVRGRCLEKYMNEEYGIYGGMTGYQRQLLTKKIVRKHCPVCGSDDVVKNSSQQKEICLACSLSWDIL